MTQARAASVLPRDGASKSVGVITFFNYDNFGAALQCYALDAVLGDLGHRATFLDYTCPFIRHAVSRNSLAKRGLLGMAYTAAGHLFYLPRRPLFCAFREPLAHTVPLTGESIGAYGSCFDAYLAGSDQIWNARLTDTDTTYLLDFVHGDARRVSYAASLGEGTLSAEQAEIYAPLLARFDALSVREEEGRAAVEGLTGRQAAVTLDPTLLLDRSRWEQVAAPNTSREPYILVYQLGFSRRLVKAARTLAKRMRLQVRYVPFPLGGAVRSRPHLRLGPAEWLALFRDASYVLTDSYHGAIFALTFERPFCVVADGQHENGRVRQLLGWLGLSDRILADRLPDDERPIDYAQVRKRLEEGRRASLDWLGDAL